MIHNIDLQACYCTFFGVQEERNRILEIFILFRRSVWTRRGGRRGPYHAGFVRLQWDLVQCG
jgi:hypothetical protein